MGVQGIGKRKITKCALKKCCVKIWAGFTFIRLCPMIESCKHGNEALYCTEFGKSDVWLTVHRNSVWIRKTNLDVTFCILYFSSNSC